jgi:hypothetical protein
MQLCIELGSDQFKLHFQVLDTPVAKLWVERMQLRDAYVLDDAKRFYGFDSPEEEIARATAFITHCIAVINDFEPIIEREFTTVDDQDCLNYLHHVFEVYHGLLDQQDHEFWRRAPDHVRRALANLNLAVHRCETASKGSRPRFVCTWFGMPKTQTLDPALIQDHGELATAFGTICLNYCEIGKTVEDLANDNDHYIADDAFKPFLHYSADFVVRMFEESDLNIKTRLDKIKEYFLNHVDFFNRCGITDYDSPLVAPYRLPVARLIETVPRDQLIKKIAQRQQVNRVYFV